jgi:hypothetical protein
VPYDGDDPTCLVGEELNAVAFVMDYVEFHFNGPVLRALADPAIESNGVRQRFPEPGSRDALCALIGTEVERVDVREGDCIELWTNVGHTLTIPLDEGSRIGSEAAHFVPSDSAGRLRVGEMLVW